MVALTGTQLADFRREGYYVVPDVLTAQELAAIESEYMGILDRVSSDLVQRGLLRPLNGTTFSQRYIEAISQLDDIGVLYQPLEICLPVMEELDASATMNAGRAVFGLLTNERLLDVVESVIGPEIWSTPPQHARIKPPSRRLSEALTESTAGSTYAKVVTSTWHRDFDTTNAADDTDIITVWVAVTDATVENGCLLVIPGSHRGSGIGEPSQAVPLPVGAGGVVLMNRGLAHSSLENSTDDIRWSFDLRYQPIDPAANHDPFPGFLARSAANPQSALTDPDAWASLWWAARDRIVAGEVTMRCPVCGELPV